MNFIQILFYFSSENLTNFSSKRIHILYKQFLSNLSISQKKKKSYLFSPPKEINKPCIDLIRVTVFRIP